MEGVKIMRLAIGAAAMALALGGFAFAAGIDGGGDDRFRTPSSTTSTTGTATTGTTTTGTTTTEDRRADDNGRGFREPGEDVRGPCDEAENANDPRCTGAATVDDDHRGRSGHGGGEDDDSGHSGRGRSGSNSGPG
jgi:hypothetical protein